MKTRHLIYASLLAATLAVSAISTASAESIPVEITAETYAAADTSFTVGDFTYIPLTDKTVTLMKYNGIDYDVKIPSTVKSGSKSYTVTAVNNGAFADNNSVGSIVVPDTVTKIGGRAFNYCTILSELTLPRNLTTIPAFMCQGDTALTSVVIPNKVVTIEERAFDGCTALSSIKMSSSLVTIKSHAFNNSAIADMCLPKCLKMLEYNAVSGIGQVLYEGTEAEWGTLKIDSYAFGSANQRVTFKQKFDSHNDYTQPKLAGVKATAASKSSITISWTKATTKAVDSFRIEVYKGKTLVETIEVKNTGSITKKTISDLAKSTKYTINVIAVKGNTESDTITKTVTTKSK